ncbi:hypothetical protein KKD45_04745 [Patescibacteria group bacterium]|nr:hypothetical protein [Patescibacteria group bacterium]MBU4309798.1 hypothetical protein [Patescibacteria group bacterium]MBU4431804.1 hypothetical protein [Patescibacteria group bacterium]MBU4578137.1 hypothetical protein [Patescibacteria group bacterium]
MKYIFAGIFVLVVIVSAQVFWFKPWCNIKGNISKTGEKIYHLIGDNYYSKTKIDELRGESWFCGEDEAVEAGWRKSK